MHIVIPTKGRPTSSTMKMLEECGVPYSIVIEPDEQGLYAEALTGNRFLQKVHVLPLNQQGIGYCRNYILGIMTEPFWMLDDDLQKFFWRDATSRTLVHVTIKEFLVRLQEGVSGLQKEGRTVGVVGCKNGTFAIPKVPWTLNTDVAHIVYVNTPVVKAKGIQYRADKKVFEDVAFLIECMQAGLNVYRMNEFVYYTVASGTNAVGGVDYSNDSKKNALIQLKTEFPDYVEILDAVTKTGQPKYKIHWKKIS